MSMKKDTAANLIDPDVFCRWSIPDFNLPVMFPKIGISPLTVDDFLGNSPKTVNRHFAITIILEFIFVDKRFFKVVTKFGLHCEESLTVS